MTHLSLSFNISLVLSHPEAPFHVPVSVSVVCPANEQVDALLEVEIVLPQSFKSFGCFFVRTIFEVFSSALFDLPDLRLDVLLGAHHRELAFESHLFLSDVES